jgi:predicted DNA-binding protein (UPF0251 family)
MMRIMRSKCLRYIEKTPPGGPVADIDDEGIDIIDNDREFLPDKYAENAELSKSLFETIVDLPPKRREAIIMYYYNDMNYKEIAKVTGTSINTVSTNISRARGVIKKTMQQKAGTDGMAAISMSSALVISRSLQDQAILRIPDTALSAFHAEWTASVPARSLKSALLGKKAAIAALCSAAVIGCVIGVPYLIESAQVPAADPAPASAQETPAQIDVDPKARIDFPGADLEGGHTNPAKAVLSLTGLGAVETAPEWTITDEATGEKIASGLGYEVTDALARMKSERHEGRYLLRFDVTDEDGVALYAQRVFELGA